MQQLTRRPQQASQGAGVLDLIRNALPFPLPFPSSRPAKVPARPMTRISSSPSLQPGTSPVSTSSMPGSVRGMHASRQRTRASRLNRTHTDASTFAPSGLSNTPRAVTPPRAGSGDLAAHFRKDSNSPGASDASLGNDSESESESDSQTFYSVARQQSRGRVRGELPGQSASDAVLCFHDSARP